MSQAIAAIGQIHLAGEFQKLFDRFKVKTGQILISPDDTEQRRRALNVRSTLIIFQIKSNTNSKWKWYYRNCRDKYGDNDRLAARVAQIIGADTLIIFSDVDGLYDKSKKIVKTVTKIDENIYSLIKKDKNSYGSGGISTKLDAAKICMNSGCHMFISNGNKDSSLKRMLRRKFSPILFLKFQVLMQEKNG